MATAGSRPRGRDTSSTGGTDIGADTREGIGTVRTGGSQSSSTSGSPGGPSASDRPAGEAGRSGDGWAGAIRQFASNRINSQKHRASEGLDEIARTIRESAQPLADNGRTTAADYVRSAASQLERFASRLDQQSLTEMAGDVQRFARRQPALFIGAAFSLGLLGARFFKSSSEQAMNDRAVGMAQQRVGS